MIAQLNELEVLLEDIREYIRDKQETLDRILTGAFEANQIDEVTYRRLSGEMCEGLTWDEAFHHFETVLQDFIESAYHHHLGRLVEGGKFIDNLPKGDKRYDAAMQKYDRIEEQITRISGWMDRRREGA